MEDLKGRVAFITGAAGGIGLAIAQTLAREGMRIVLADIDAPELDKARGAVDGEVLSVVLDITERASWANAKAAAKARFGQVDVLCNNAGIGPNGALLAQMTSDTFERVIRTNITGAFNGVSTFVPAMIERRTGHVVNTSSMVGLHPMGGLGAYTASKFGLLGLTYALREELAPHGFGVTALCPGRVDSRLTQTTQAMEPDSPRSRAPSCRWSETSSSKSRR